MEAQRPSRVRYAVVACAVAMSVLLYLDRFCVSFAEIYMKQDLGLTDKQIGWMLSVFFWAYAICQVPSGWLTDRFGARVTLTVYILGWSLFTAAMGIAQGVWLLLAARFLCGVFQAGAYPTSAALLSRWVPLHSRGLASSLVALGGRAGGALAPLLTAVLIVAFVPTHQSSLLQPGDILRPSHLATTWLERARTIRESNGENSLREQGSMRLLPRDTRLRYASSWLLGRMAPSVQQRLMQLAEVEPVGRAASTDGPLEKLLATELNRELELPDLAKQQFVLLEELPREGQWLLKKCAVKTADSSERHFTPESLRPAERQRLNRLILEAVFPDHLRRVYVAGWRPIMFTYGLLGIPVALAFWWMFRNRPEEHPWCNEQERDLISAGRVIQQAHKPIGGAPVLALLTHTSMWCNSISQFATNIGWIFLTTWLPRYLDEVHRVPVERRAIMTLIPVLVGFVGLVYGGRLTDRLVTVVGLRWGRALPMGLSKFVAAIAYLICLTNPPPEICVALFALVSLASDLGIGAIWAYAQDVGGRHVGSVLGWANMWGNIGAAIGPLLIISVIGPDHHWQWAFILCAAAYAVAAASALAVNAEKPLLPARENGAHDAGAANDSSR